MYLEGPVDNPAEDAAYELEDENLSFSNNDEVEFPLQDSDGTKFSLQEEEKSRDTEDSEIDYCCKQFADFMLAQYNIKYDLRSSRKRTSTQDQEEEAPLQKDALAQKESTVQKVTDKYFADDGRNLTPLDNQRKEEGNSVEDFNPWNEEIGSLEIMLNKHDLMQEEEPQFLNWGLQDVKIQGNKDSEEFLGLVRDLGFMRK